MSGVSFTDEAPPVDEYEVVAIDGGDIAGRDDLMEALAGALGLPEWFGRNWDALDDVLRDAELRNSARLLVVTDSTVLWREHPRLAGALVELWLGSDSSVRLAFEW